MQVHDLFAEAVRAREQAYAPYSGFAVGAALQGKSGKVYHGCNIENASYGAAICAERVALGNAVAHGEREFTAIAVVGEAVEPVVPCGMCRQVLAEFSSHMMVVMGTLSGKTVTLRLDELYPYAFEASALGGSDSK